MQYKLSFMDGIVKIFQDKIKEAKRLKNGWSAREIFCDVASEQQLTDPEKDIAWCILIEDVLGYTQEKIKGLENEWQKNRERLISEGDTPVSFKPTKRLSPTLH